MNKLSPYFIPSVLANSPAGFISRKYGCRGAVNVPSVACASGAAAIGEGFRYLKSTDSLEESCDVVLAGATEAAISELGLLGFDRIGALTRSTDVSSASRPFDNDRDGFVLGEGCGILVLERLSSALSRNASIYAEIVSYSNSNDAHHPTTPDPKGEGAIKAIQNALRHIPRDTIVAVNAHATSTKLGDEIELFALKAAGVPDGISVTSNKGNFGHLLGAAGAVESAICVLSLLHQLIPGNTRALRNPITSHFKLPSKPVEIKRKDAVILKTSFGFGGVNVAMCFKSFSQ